MNSVLERMWKEAVMAQFQVALSEESSEHQGKNKAA
jgi:hypothetical protein